MSVPLLELKGFTRIHLLPGDKETVQFTVNATQMSFANEAGDWVLEPGEFKVWVGGQQPSYDASQPANGLEGKFIVVA